MRYLPDSGKYTNLTVLQGSGLCRTALFGYAAGKLIESFSTFYHEHHNTIAQFHEWMTGKVFYT